MAYGRLDVFFPDGLLSTYLLIDPNTSVGRAPGNTIALETDTISRYHLTITQQGGNVFVTDLDSANGTFMDGVRLAQSTPHKLYGGEEVIIGELRLIFQDVDENPTRPMLIPETTQMTERVHTDFRFELEAPEIAISPGAHTAARLRLANTGNKPERYTITVEGVPKNWVRIDRPELEIAPGKDAEVAISFKPLRQPESTPGNYPIKVSVMPKGKPDAVLALTAPLHVLAYSGFGVALENAHVRGGANGGRFRLHVHNQGSGTLPLTIRARDLEEALQITLTSNALTLAPGQRAVVDGVAKARKAPLFGEAQRHLFDLVVKSGDAAGFTIARRASIDVKPPLPRWAAFVGGGIGAAILAIILLGLIALLQPARTPTINTFTANAAQIAPGDPITLNWTADNIQNFTLLVNGTPLSNLAGDAREAQINTNGFDGGSLAILLRGTRGDEVVEQTVTVAVIDPLQVRAFTIEPLNPLRFVAQTITLRWDAPGAVSARLEGIEGLSTTPLDADYGAAETVALSILPTEASYTLRLIIEDAEGSTRESNLTITTIDPQCETVGDTVLYDTPNTNGQIVSTVPQGSVLIVDAQDASNGYLRAVGRGWGQRSAFLCAGFNPEDLLKALSVPTAAPTTALLTSTAQIALPPASLPTQAPPVNPAPLVPLTAGTAIPTPPPGLSAGAQALRTGTPLPPNPLGQIVSTLLVFTPTPTLNATPAG